MSEIHIHVPQQNYPTAWKEAIYHSIQSAPELGMVYKANLSDLLTENMYRTGLWFCTSEPLTRYSSDTIDVIGAAICGSRAASTHMWRHGDICVPNKMRRQRIGTALYFAQHCQAILEGRRILEDTIVPALSPWMVRPSACGAGFLRVLGYEQYGLLPQRTQGFRDIELWGQQTIQGYHAGFARLQGRQVIIELRDTIKTLEGYTKNLAIFKSHDPQLAKDVESLRTLLTTSPSWEWEGSEGVALQINYRFVTPEEQRTTQRGGQRNGERS